jgi:hypothetical protein
MNDPGSSTRWAARLEQATVTVQALTCLVRAVTDLVYASRWLIVSLCTLLLAIDAMLQLR